MKKDDVPISKYSLRNKYIEYRDHDGKFRISEVKKVIGNKVKVKITGRKSLVTVEQKNIFYNIHHGHCRREIDWTIKRKKKIKEE